MIQYGSLPTALAKCPVEIWCEILRFATQAEGPDMLKDPMTMERFYIDGTSHGDITEVYEDRLKSLVDMRNFATVCRQWRWILHPLRLRWVIINQVAQLKGVSGYVERICKTGQVGRWTKRLELRARIIHGDVMERFDDAHGRKRPSISRMLQCCPQLEEFISMTSALTYPTLCSDLIANCGRTLKTVILRSTMSQRFDDIVNLLLYCPRLEYLHFGGPKYETPSGYDYPGSRFGRSLSLRDIPEILSTRHLALRVLVWEIKHAQPHDEPLSFARLFGLLRLPNLRHVGLHMDERSGIYDDNAFVHEEILPMLLKPGRNVTSVSLTRTTAGPRTRHVFPFIELCPKIEQFAFHVPHALIYDVGAYLGQPVKTLRKIQLHEFFYNPPEYNPYFISQHVETVLSMVKALCRLSTYPNLDTIQFMDVYPVTDEARAMRATHGDFPREYRTLMAKLMRIGYVRRVKLLDAHGNPVGADFAPPNWYYAWGFEGLGLFSST